MIIATVGTGALRRSSSSRSLVIVRRRLDYEAWYARPPRAPTRRSRSAGSTRSRPATSSSSTRPPPTTGAPLRRDARVLVVVPASCVPAWNALRYRLRVAEVVAGRRPASSRCASRAAALDRLRARRGPVLPLALPRSRAAGGRRIRSRSRRRPTGLASDHGQGSRRLHAAASARSAPGTRVVAEGPLGRLHGRRCGAARRRCWSPAASASRRPRARRGDGRRRRRRSTACCARRRRLFDELESLAAERGSGSSSSPATTRTDEGRDLLSPRPPARARARPLRARRLRLRAAGDGDAIVRTLRARACRAATSTSRSSPSDERNTRKELVCAEHVLALDRRRARGAGRERGGRRQRRGEGDREEESSRRRRRGPVRSRPTAGAPSR